MQGLSFPAGLACAKLSGRSEPLRIPSRSAFTLAELLTVIAIIAVLVAISFGALNAVKLRSANARAQGELAVLAQALEDYKRHYGEYPQTPTPETPQRLYQALTGAIGPSGASINGRGFVSLSQFALHHDESAPTDQADNFFVDPWNNAYRYAFYRQAQPVNRRGYVLYSLGADGVDGVPPSPDDGSVDFTAPGNRDNIYAGQ